MCHSNLLCDRFFLSPDDLSCGLRLGDTYEMTLLSETRYVASSSSSGTLLPIMECLHLAKAKSKEEVAQAIMEGVDIPPAMANLIKER